MHCQAIACSAHPCSETQLDAHNDIATLGFIEGFIEMLVLDEALG